MWNHVLNIFVIINCFTIALAFHLHIEDNFIAEFSTFRVTVKTTTTKTAEIPCHKYWTIEKLPHAEDVIAAHSDSILGTYLNHTNDCVEDNQKQYVCRRGLMFRQCMRAAKRKTMMQLYEETEECAAQNNLTHVNYKRQLMHMNLNMDHVPQHACYLTCVLQKIGVFDANKEVNLNLAKDFFRRFDIDIARKNYMCKVKTPSHLSLEDCSANYWEMQCTYRKALAEFAVDVRMMHGYEIIEKIFD